jgi:hypothetical protein
VCLAPLIILRGETWAGEKPVPPSRDSNVSVALATVVEDDAGKLQIRLLIPNMCPAKAKVTVEVDGKQQERVMTVMVPKGWLEMTLPLDDKKAQVLDIKGNPVGEKAVARKLAKTTPVLFASYDKPDPYYLQTTKEDTLIVVTTDQVCFLQHKGQDKPSTTRTQRSEQSKEEPEWKRILDMIQGDLQKQRNALWERFEKAIEDGEKLHITVVLSVEFACADERQRLQLAKFLRSAKSKKWPPGKWPGERGAFVATYALAFLGESEAELEMFAYLRAKEKKPARVQENSLGAWFAGLATIGDAG